MPIYQLDEGLWFPNPRNGEPDGLFAIGGDLSPKRLLLAYSNGIFPWFAYEYYSEPHWYCPMERFVIFPNEIHISHSMKQLMRKGQYEITINQDFPNVIRGCSHANSRHKQDGAWLGPDMIKAYTELHQMQVAFSVEVWENVKQEADPSFIHQSINSSPKENTVSQNDSKECKSPHFENKRLVGGLYGVCLGNTFFGESMFSLVPNASKLALIHLAQQLQKVPGSLIDCQFETPHLLSMGGRHIPYDEYMAILKGETCNR